MMMSHVTCPEEEEDEEEEEDIETIEFSLVGLVATFEFQKCLTYIETLHKTYPKIYRTPFIRPMLEFDWLEYVTKMQRKMGREFWRLKKNAVVFVNKEYLGDDVDLLAFIAKRLNVRLRRDYECLSQKGLLDVYQKYMELGLYADLVPKTCKRFIKKCESRKNGFKGTDIHRIMAASWIQFGGFKLPLKNCSCENYSIPHNRRGVLSMCNDGRNVHNTSQFFVCLNPTDWMDFRYVAFGQMVQGDNVLKAIENKSTHYEHPEPDSLIIADCGEITLEDTVRAKQTRAIEKYLATRDASGEPLIDIVDSRDTVSVLLEAHFEAGDYFFVGDNAPHLPMRNLPLLDETISLVTSLLSADLEMYEDTHSLLLQEIFFPQFLYLNEVEPGENFVQTKLEYKGNGAGVVGTDYDKLVSEYLETIKADEDNEE